MTASNVAKKKPLLFLFLSALVVIGILGTAGVLFIPASATGSPATFSVTGAGSVSSLRPPGFIFLTEPNCDYTFSDQFNKNIRLPSPDIDKYGAQYQVLCYGGIKDFWVIDHISAPIMRLFYPDRVFVFVFDHKTQSADFNRMVAAKNSNDAGLVNSNVYQQMQSGAEVADGYSDISKGYGYADDSLPYNAKHEMTHLWTCGTWHDANAMATGKLTKYPGSDQYSWCK